jgi:hypothetical protein
MENPLTTDSRKFTSTGTSPGVFSPNLTQYTILVSILPSVSVLVYTAGLPVIVLISIPIGTCAIIPSISNNAGLR